MKPNSALPRARWWPVIIAALIFAASSRPTVASPDISNIDKVSHFMVFGLLATLVCRLRTGRRWAICALAIASGFGATDELHQAFVPGRTPALDDWVADTLGAALAVTLYTRWTWYRELLETDLWPRTADGLKTPTAAQESAAE